MYVLYILYMFHMYVLSWRGTLDVPFKMILGQKVRSQIVLAEVNSPPPSISSAHSKTPYYFFGNSKEARCIEQGGGHCFLESSEFPVHGSVSCWIAEGSTEPKTRCSHQVPHLQPDRQRCPRALQLCSLWHPEGTREASFSRENASWLSESPLEARANPVSWWQVKILYFLLVWERGEM